VITERWKIDEEGGGRRMERAKREKKRSLHDPGTNPSKCTDSNLLPDEQSFHRNIF
jgi:hypothetical protein